MRLINACTDRRIISIRSDGAEGITRTQLLPTWPRNDAQCDISLFNAFFLSHLCEYHHHKSYIADGLHVVALQHCEVTAHKATEFGEITQNNGHYAVQGHSRSPISVRMESLYATSYVSITVTYFVSCAVSEIRWIIGPIFAVDSTGGAWLLTHRLRKPLNSGLRTLVSRN